MPSFEQEKNSMTGAITVFLKDPIGKKLIDDYIAGITSIVIVDLDELAKINQGTTCKEFVDFAGKYGLAALENAVINEVVNMSAGAKTIDKEHISITGNLPLALIHKIGAENIGHLVKIHGLVNKTAPIHPMYVEAVFKCVMCNTESQPIVQENPWTLTKPLPKCDVCDDRTTWEPIPQLSELVDSQEFTIQESYDDIPSNKIPRPIRCITFKNHLLNVANCGDDVEALCIVNAMSASQKFVKTKFNVVYLEILAINKRRKDPEAMVFTAEEELAFKELIKDPDFYMKMVNSLAPSLYGHDNEKEAVLLAIFGSPEEIREDLTIRGNIHILMVGDPATAKSQLLRAAVELSPRGMYAMGRGTTAAGLTAALHRENDTGEWEISAGVLVLADEGVAAIDEIDKMKEEDRVNIHEAMEQQTVSIDKAGYHVQLKARTAVIAAANPSLGRYDQYKSVFENLPKFPPSLFSRFDLIFKVLDIPNEQADREVVDHIIDSENLKSPIDRKLLKRYIAYSKRIKPKLSDEAAESLKNYFVAVRKGYTSDQKTFPFSYRQFEALKRLTLARARSLLKLEADAKDVEVVKRLFDVFLKDTIGGDVTQVETGQSTSQTSLIKIMMEAFRSHDMTKNDARNLVHCDDDEKFEKAWAKLIGDNYIYRKGLALNNQEVYGTCS